jgi:thioredoxin 1
MLRAASSILQSSFSGELMTSLSKPNDLDLRVWRKKPVSHNIVHTNDSNFDTDVLQSDRPVLLDFWAEWCGPCKMIAPLLDEAASEYADKLAVVKLNIDENPNTPQKFGIRSIPTLMLFKDGAVAAQKLGAMSKSQLTEFLESNL